MEGGTTKPEPCLDSDSIVKASQTGTNQVSREDLPLLPSTEVGVTKPRKTNKKN